MDGILGDLERLRHYAAGLGELLTEFQWAVAVLGRDGLPEAIRVSLLWKDRLTPESFGGAVTGACQAAAMRERGAEWSQVLERADWRERMARLEADSERVAAADSDPAPTAFRPATGSTESIRPRPLDVLAEEAMRALDAVTRPAAGPAA